MTSADIRLFRYEVSSCLIKNAHFRQIGEKEKRKKAFLFEEAERPAEIYARYVSWH
jgi:hypothetical protein